MITTSGPPDVPVERFVTEGDGYTTWHTFSSGAHYDPDRISWGPVIAIDEHLVQPDGGFEWHPHRGVHIASWVLEGALRHEDSTGTVRVVTPGEFLLQSTGDGLEHRETNPSDTELLRMIQVMVLGSAPHAVHVEPPPVQVGEVSIEVAHGDLPDDAAIFELGSGAFHPDGVDREVDGDALVLRLLSKA